MKPYRSHKISFANIQAIMPQNRIGRRDMKVKISQPKSADVFQSCEHLAREKVDRDITRLASHKLLFLEGIEKRHRLVYMHF